MSVEAVEQCLEHLYGEVRAAHPELFGSQTDEMDLSGPVLSYVVNYVAERLKRQMVAT